MLATLSASNEASPPLNHKPYQYETFIDYVPTVGWRRCHRLSFPCLTGQYEISQHFLFGKTNKHEIKFETGLCHADSLLCVMSSFCEESQILTILLAETDDSEAWPDDIVDHLQPKKGHDEFTVPCECQFVHTEWDETSYWGCPEEETRKVDFLGWISTRTW